MRIFSVDCKSLEMFGLVFISFVILFLFGLLYKFATADGDFTLLAKRHVKREGIEDKASQLRSIVIDQFFIYLKFCQMLRSTGLLVPAVESGSFLQNNWQVMGPSL